MPKTHYPRECPLCGKNIIQMSKHFNKTHKTTITDWQLEQHARGLEATIGPRLRQAAYGSGALQIKETEK